MPEYYGPDIITTLAKRLRPYLLSVSEASINANEWGKIIRVGTVTSDVEFYEPTEAGVTAALGDCSSGHKLYFPRSITIAMTAGITIPAGVKVREPSLSFSGFSGVAVDLSSGASIGEFDITMDGTGEATATAVRINGVAAHLTRGNVRANDATTNIAVQAGGAGTLDNRANINTLFCSASGGTTSYGIVIQDDVVAVNIYGEAVGASSSNQGIRLNITSLNTDDYLYGVYGRAEGTGAYGIFVPDGKYGRALYLRASGDTKDIYIGTGSELQIFAVQYDSITNNGTLTNLPPSGGATGSGILGWFNVEDFGAVHDGVTDDTTAIQDTIDAADAAGGGVVYFPSGIYIVGGALQDTGRANAQLLLPTKDVETDDAISITFLGEYAPVFNVALITTPGTDFLSGSIIKGTLNAGAGGALIGGMSTVASSYDFTRITARFENLTFRMPDNPILSALNLTNVSVTEIDKCAFDVGAVTDVPDVTEPTTATSFALQTPDESNGAHTSLNDIRIVGYYNGIKIGEHCDMDNIHITGCKYAFVASADVGVHPWYGKRLLIQHCPYGLTISDECYFEIEQLAIEHYDASPSTWYDPVYDLNDASNLGTGIIRYKSTLANAATRDELIINGASGITVLGIDEATNPTLSYWEPAVDADGDDIMFNSGGDIAMVWIV